jgi:hypothetical protein
LDTEFILRRHENDSSTLDRDTRALGLAVRYPPHGFAQEPSTKDKAAAQTKKAANKTEQAVEKTGEAITDTWNPTRSQGGLRQREDP